MTREDFGNAFEENYSSVWRFLRSRGASEDEAHEITQAAWVRGWERRAQLRDESLVTAWVLSIARNFWLKAFEQPPHLTLKEFDESYLHDTTSLQLRTLFEVLAEEDRKLMESTLQGFSDEEVAETVGITRGGLRKRKFVVRGRIRNRLELRRLIRSAQIEVVA